MCPSSRPLAAEAAHRRLRRDHAELERRLAVAVRELGALTEGMNGDGIPEDRSEAALGCRVERVLEQPAEDTEPPIGGVDDCGTRLGGGDTRERHQRVMPDNSPFVDGDRRQNSSEASAAINTAAGRSRRAHSSGGSSRRGAGRSPQRRGASRSSPRLRRELLPTCARLGAASMWCRLARPSSLERTVTSTASRFPSEPRFISSTLRTSDRAASDSGSGPRPLQHSLAAGPSRAR